MGLAALPATAVSLSTLSGLADNLAHTLTFNVSTNASVSTINLSDGYGGTATLTGTLGSQVLNFTITGGVNSGATMTLTLASNGLVANSEGTVKYNAIGDFTAPDQALFDVRRKSLSSIWNYVRENADYPYYLIKDRLAKSDAGSREDLAPGQGKILKINGQRVAVFRNAAGEFIELSPVCTHLGCLVNWNEAERTWDCPCHGSRFLGSGEVFAGPAEKPLAPIEKDHEPVTTGPRGEADSW